MIIRLFIFTIFFISSIPALCLAKTHKIGILPYYKSEALLNYYRPFVKYLNEQTGISWEIKLFPNYERLIDAICKKEVSVAYLGYVPFGLAYEKCKAKPLLVNLGTDGKPFYKSFIVSSNRKIRSLKDLKGQKIAFGDRHSTSSYIVPRRMFEDEGISINDLKPVFFKDHERILEAVINGEVMAGAVKDSALRRYKSFDFKIIKESEPIPNHTFCSSSRLKAKEENSFKNALLRLKPLQNKSDKKITDKWDPEIQHGFVLPPENYIKGVERLLKTYKRYNRL